MNARAVLCLILAGLAGCGPEPQRRIADLPLTDVKALPQARITADLDAPLDPTKDTLYCSTMQLAWNELRGVVKGDVRLEGDPPLAQALNRDSSLRVAPSEDAYVAVADTLKSGVVERTNARLRDVFGGSAPTVQVKGAAPDGVVAYAYLAKDLSFATPFERLKEGMRFYSKGTQATEVQAFGVLKDGLAKGDRVGMVRQVSILFHGGDSNSAGEEFAVRLQTKTPGDELVLARVKPGKTLRETVESVERRAAAFQEDRRLHAMDELYVPELNLAVFREFEELLGRGVLNPGFEALQVVQARQDIRFSLDEYGVRLRSTAQVEVEASAPRIFAFSGPFLVWLRHTESQRPYFAIWVATPGFMAAPAR